MSQSPPAFPINSAAVRLSTRLNPKRRFVLLALRLLPQTDQQGAGDLNLSESEPNRGRFRLAPPPPRRRQRLWRWVVKTLLFHLHSFMNNS